MYRVYLYYFRGQRTKDFEIQADAFRYAAIILSLGRVKHVKVVDMENGRWKEWKIERGFLSDFIRRSY